MQYFLWLRHKILVCFSSSSVAIVVPTLRELKVKSRVKSIMTSAILAGLSLRTSLGMEILTAPQISTTLATANLAVNYGIFRESLLAALVVLSLVTITIAPFLTKLVLPHKTTTLPPPTKFEKRWLVTR